MRVLKFGGTSVGSPENMRRVAAIVAEQTEQTFVVVSALSGVTNMLQALGNSIKKKDKSAISIQLSHINTRHFDFISQMFSGDALLEIRNVITKQLEILDTYATSTYSNLLEKKILAQGELLSSAIFTHFLRSKGHNAKRLAALEFMRIDRLGEPDEYYIKSMLGKIIEAQPAQIYVTQGYICRNAFGEVDNLKRGGSDYTATLLGAALDAEIQIWTDIDGMHNNDPRVVEQTRSIERLSYAEAAELAYFGAKILHPTCVYPAERKGIDIWLKNTLDPSAKGTLISAEGENGLITAIAAKDHITAVKIKSGRMLHAYGFLKQTFEIFEKHRTSIDCVTTSEVAVSLTVDDDTRLDDIMEELRVLGHVSVDKNQSIICIVGDFIAAQMGVAQKIFSALSNVPIRMISYGGSPHNVTILIETKHKKTALQQLNKVLFGL